MLPASDLGVQGWAGQQDACEGRSACSCGGSCLQQHYTVAQQRQISEGSKLCTRSFADMLAYVSASQHPLWLKAVMLAGRCAGHVLSICTYLGGQPRGL